MKEFIKFTFSKLILTISLIISSIVGMRIIVALSTPTENFESITETLFFRLRHILDIPAAIISRVFGDLCSFIGAGSNSICFNIGGFSYFILNIFTFYLLACLIIFIFRKIKANFFIE